MRHFRFFRLAAATALIAAAMSGAALANKTKNSTAVFSGLDKITGRIITFEASVDETVQFGSLLLTTRACYARTDRDNKQVTFIEVDEVMNDNQYKRIFAGWMLAESPGLSAIDHPVYDVWLTDCKGVVETVNAPPEQDEIEEIPPPNADAIKRAPRPPLTTTSNRPGANPASGAPLRLPDAGGVPLPPGAIVSRPAPQQRFFPTNTPSGRGGAVYDPAGGANR